VDKCKDKSASASAAPNAQSRQNRQPKTKTPPKGGWSHFITKARKIARRTHCPSQSSRRFQGLFSFAAWHARTASNSSRLTKSRLPIQRPAFFTRPLLRFFALARPGIFINCETVVENLLPRLAWSFSPDRLLVTKGCNCFLQWVDFPFAVRLKSAIMAISSRPGTRDIPFYLICMTLRPGWYALLLPAS